MRNPETGEDMTLAEKKEYINRHKALLSLMGVSFKGDIANAIGEQTKAHQEEIRKAEYDKSVGTMQTTLKSFMTAHEVDFKALGKAWINKDDVDLEGRPQSGVYFDVMKILTSRFNVNDPVEVTPESLEDAYYLYLKGVTGGLEMIKNNAKNEAKKEADEAHRRKIRLKVMPKVGSEKRVNAGKNVLDAINNPKVTFDQAAKMLRDAGVR
jgi:hypothetical protein